MEHRHGQVPQLIFLIFFRISSFQLIEHIAEKEQIGNIVDFIDQSFASEEEEKRMDRSASRSAMVLPIDHRHENIQAIHFDLFILQYVFRSGQIVFQRDGRIFVEFSSKKENDFCLHRGNSVRLTVDALGPSILHTTR